MTTELPQEDNETYDNTRLSGYKTCPRSYFLRHVKGWTTEGDSIPIYFTFGSAWHAGLDATWQYAKGNNQSQLTELAMLSFLEKWEEEGQNPNLSLNDQASLAPRTPMIANEMFYNYIEQRWAMLQEAELLAGEQPFAVPMPGMDNVWYIGRLDKAIRYNGQNLILEHKTTTSYRIQTNFDPMYVESWYSSSQVKGYEFAGTMYYQKIGGVWVDAALVHKKVHDAFKFIPINHSYYLLESWLQDTQQWTLRVQQEVNAYKQAGKLEPGMFPKNEEACYGKYGTCPFLDICRTVSDPGELDEAPAGYQQKVWNPFDVLGLNKLINNTTEEK